VWLNKPGAFEPHPLDVEADVVALGDADGDGDLDLIGVATPHDPAPPSVTLWRNDGAGQLVGARLDLPLDGAPGQPALGLATDLELIARADGGADLWFIAHEGTDGASPIYVAIDHLTAAGRLGLSTVSRASGDELRLGDVNGDGLLDALAVSSGGGHAAVAISGADGTLGAALDVALAPAGGALADLLDYDGDGLDDIVYETPYYARGKLSQVHNLSE
jgi:hypothetical protein